MTINFFESKLRIHIHTHTHTHIYIYIYTYMNTCTGWHRSRATRSSTPSTS